MDVREQIEDAIFNNLNHNNELQCTLWEIADQILALFQEAGWKSPEETDCMRGCPYNTKDENVDETDPL